MANWSELPGDLIGYIDQRLSCVEDSVSFAAVCKSWRSVVIHNKLKRNKSFGPWLMLAKLENDHMTKEKEKARVRSCYSLFSNKIFNLALPELQGRRCWGTTHGWLFTIGLDLNIFLFHPFSKIKISLPSQPNFILKECQYSNSRRVCKSFINRAALSSNPSDSSHSFVAMVIYEGGFQIGFASPGYKSWTCIETHYAIEDVIFFKGNFYFLDGKGVLWICNINTSTAQPVASPPKRFKYLHRKFYLVEICGRLYFINRRHDPCNTPVSDPVSDPISDSDSDSDIDSIDSDSEYHVETLDFDAFVFNSHKKKWLGIVKDFKGHALLLGNNTSCAISTFDHPELRPNCIYFTDDFSLIYNSESGVFNDMGVYDFKMKTLVEPFYKTKELASKFSRPFFFLPTLA